MRPPGSSWTVRERMIPYEGRKLMEEKKRQAAVFLDRDGTINEEVGYLDRLEKLTLISGAAGAIRLINESGMKAIVVTNQAGIARGFFDEAFVEAAHARLGEMLRAEGAFIDGFYYCPHHPTEGREPYLRECDCRKPAPGLLVRAARELFVDPACSYMVGDTLKDIEAGARASVQGVLVLTGYGKEFRAALEAQGKDRGNRHGAEARPAVREPFVRPVHIAADLSAAVRWILRSRRP
jgi:D-glycero-D-manno-heptose 1,7-bisphosphate phosphatase